MSKHLTLDEAVEQIKDWRQSKKGTRERIPEYCWRHAIRLSKEHTPKVVANKMSLKLSDLQNKINHFILPLNHIKKIKEKMPEKTSKLKDKFIQMPKTFFDSINKEMPKEIASIEKCILELDLNNGMKLRIFG